jgi:cysteine desulfuration protein SufE
MVAVQEQIVAEMEELGDTLEKYEYLVSRGRAHAAPDDSLRRDEHVVPGCSSRVWIRSELRDGLLHIEADSEAMINRGIIALLLRVLDRRPPAEILDGDLFFLDRTGLGAHLSPARANGLAAMVRRIRGLAEDAI